MKQKLADFFEVFYIIIGCFVALGISFYLISIGKALISFIIASVVTWFCFATAKKNKKKIGWILMGILSSLFNLLSIIAVIQLIIG